MATSLSLNYDLICGASSTNFRLASDSEMVVSMGWFIFSRFSE